MVSAVIAALLAGAGAGVAAQRPEVVVSAAASLTDVLQQLAPVYEAGAGDRVVLNLAASNTLARPVAAGARVDLFISADEARMESVRGHLVPGTQVALLSNQLAVAVPDDRPVELTSIRELAGPSFRRIAVGDPAAVPAGVYAKAYLTRAGLWAQLAPRLLPSSSVRLALAAVENGAADAAIVYRTDIAAAARAVEAFVVPASEGPRIVYAAARVRDGDAPEAAARFLAFLQGAEAAAVFTAAGFVPLQAR
jgi:molybdate transport system substrate-binding protein